jgi:hypothetical protein
MNTLYNEWLSTEKGETRPQICVLPKTRMFSTISNTKVDFLHQTNLLFVISMKKCVEPYMFRCVSAILCFSQNFIFSVYQKSKRMFPSHSVRSCSRWIDLTSLIRKKIVFISGSINVAQACYLVLAGKKTVFNEKLYENGIKEAHE